MKVKLYFYYIISLVTIFLLTFNGWIEENLEKPEVNPIGIKLRLNDKFEPAIKNFSQTSNDYILYKKKYNAFTNYSLSLLKNQSMLTSTTTLEKYKAEYIAINKNINDTLKLIQSSEDTINSIFEKSKREYNIIKKSNYNVPLNLKAANSTFSNIKKKYLYIKNSLMNFRKDIENDKTAIESINNKIINYTNKKDTNNTKTSNKETISINSNIKINSITAKIDKKISPESLKLSEQANKLLNENKVNEAIKLYKKAIEIDNNNYKAHQGLSNAYLKLNKTDLSIKEINQAIEIFKKLSSQ